MIANKQIYLKSLVIELNKIHPDNKRINIVFHGHSVPCGFTNSKVVDTFNSYPQYVFRYLKNRFPMAVINIIVTGVGGEDSIKGAKRFKEEVMSFPSDLIIIDYGMNDRFCELTEVKAAWENMTKIALSENKKVILMSPSFDADCIYYDKSQIKFDLLKSTELIKEVAENNQVAFVNNLETMTDMLKNGYSKNDFLASANHPNPFGNKILAKGICSWFPYI